MGRIGGKNVREVEISHLYQKGIVFSLDFNKMIG